MSKVLSKLLGQGKPSHKRISVQPFTRLYMGFRSSHSPVYENPERKNPDKRKAIKP